MIETRAHLTPQALFLNFSVMKISQIFQKCRNFTTRKKRETLKSGKIQILGFKRQHLSTSSSNEEPLKELINYLDNLKNYEKSGVPKGAGIDSDTTGFDMGRMNRLMEGLGNPQSKFKTVHIAGTKGKGSTAMFLSNILRKEGYSVGCYTSPHLWSIRERILLGRQGKPVSAEALNRLFSGVKNILDRSIEIENGSISHFEVLTAVTFSLFAQENVDIAVVEAGLGGARDATNVFSSSDLIASVITTIGEEHLAALGGSLESIALAKSGIMKHARPVVLGGPFEPCIERILHDRAVLMNSPIISAYSLGNKSTIKGVKVNNGRPYQSCDILLDFQKDPKSFLELFDVRLSMLGRHQLQNAVTASCAALAFRDQGWKVADESIRIGLESTYLPGRSQFLTPEEVSEIGLDGATVLVDGAHTKESARALVDTIQLTYPDAALAFVVAMASDKDHPAFAKELLSGRNTIEAVVFTEISIAGERSRMTAASSLKNAWTRAATELGNSFSDGSSEKFGSSYDQGQQKPELVVLGSVKDSMKVADEILRLRSKGRSNLIVVTGSLHIVSVVLTSLQRSE